MFEYEKRERTNNLVLRFIGNFFGSMFSWAVGKIVMDQKISGFYVWLAGWTYPIRLKWGTYIVPLDYVDPNNDTE